MSRAGVNSGQLGSGKLDPATFEVIRHRLWAINDEQAMVAARVSGSPVVYEVFDFNAGLLNAEGDGLVVGVYLIDQAVPIDIFVRQVLEMWPADQIKEGDMFFTNDPWSGALHANDGILASPIFYEGEIVCWTGIVMHDDDVGGPVPGSFVVGANDRFGEAPLLPPIKLVENFEFREDLERAFLRNHRTPESNALNLRARLAALTGTHSRIHELIDEYDKETFLACQREIIDYTERVLRRRLREIPDGTWFEHAFCDHDGIQNELYEIRLALSKQGDRLILDFTGTAPQAPGAINCTRAGLEGASLGTFFVFLCYDLPWSTAAARRIIEIVSEEGTLNNASSPAAASMASLMAGHATHLAVSNALAKMLESSSTYRQEAQACWTGSISGHVIAGLDRFGEPFAAALTDGAAGGGGARTFEDGIDSGGFLRSLSCTISNVEVNESRYPILQLYRRERADSGGYGRFRGGMAIEYGLILHKSPADLATVVFGESVAQPAAYGLSGGGPGSTLANWILRSSNIEQIFRAGQSVTADDEIESADVTVLAAKDQTMLAARDVHIGRLAGGGGYGDPLRRDPALVLADVLRGHVSDGVASSTYGVVIRDDEVAAEETEQLRERLRGERLSESSPVTKVSERVLADATPVHPVVDTVEAVELAGERRLRCTDCHHDLGDYRDDFKTWTVMRERSIEALSPLNKLGLVDVIVAREFFCPGCGAAVALDVQKRGDLILPECRFGSRIDDHDS